MQLLGWTGIGMTLGCIAIGLLEADTPFWLIALVVVGYGSVVISWNGTSQAEFAHLSPPGETAAVAAVQTALAFSGAVFGPPLFALIASTRQLPRGLLRRRRLRAGRRGLADCCGGSRHNNAVIPNEVRDLYGSAKVPRYARDDRVRVFAPPAKAPSSPRR